LTKETIGGRGGVAGPIVPVVVDRLEVEALFGGKAGA
jgi:hypothetical protein